MGADHTADMLLRQHFKVVFCGSSETGGQIELSATSRSPRQQLMQQHVSLYCFCGAGSTGYIPSAARYAQRLLRPEPNANDVTELARKSLR